MLANTKHRCYIKDPKDGLVKNSIHIKKKSRPILDVSKKRPFFFKLATFFKTPPVVESQEIPLQSGLFDFLQYFPSKKTTSTDSNTINFNLDKTNNMFDLAETNDETIINISLPLLEQDVIFPNRSDDKDIVECSSLEDCKDFKILLSKKKLSSNMFPDEDLGCPTNEDIKDLNLTHKKENGLYTVDKKTVTVDEYETPVSEILDIEPPHGNKCNTITTRLSLQTDLILNNNNQSSERNHDQEKESTTEEIPHQYETEGSDDFNSTFDSNIMTEE